jgi:hypothetical protein
MEGFMVARLGLFALLTALVAGLGGCKGEITDDDLDLWANSTVGWEKIAEVVEDAGVPVAIKVKALTRLVINGNVSKVADILYRTAFKDEIAAGLKTSMLEGFTKATSEEEKYLLKDGLLVVSEIVKPEERGPLQKMVAEWAFQGLTEADDTEKIRKQIERRVTLDQVPALGPYGIDGAALLLTRGFGVDKMFKYLKETGKPEVLEKALEAFKKLHKTPNIQISPSHLQMISEIATLSAIEYLFDIYYGETVEETVREDALALAINMFDKPEVQAFKDKLVPILKRVMQQKHPENRRLAGHYAMKLGGAIEFKLVFDGFVDDRVMTEDSIEMQPFFRDFCLDDILTLPKEVWESTVKEYAQRSPNRFLRTFSLVCLKMTADTGYLDLFRGVGDDKTEIPDLIGPGMTIGRLANNAITTLDRIGKIRADVAAGALPKADGDLKIELYKQNLEFADAYLDEFVQIKFGAEKKKRASLEAAAAAAPTPAPAAAPAPAPAPAN